MCSWKAAYDMGTKIWDTINPKVKKAEDSGQKLVDNHRQILRESIDYLMDEKVKPMARNLEMTAIKIANNLKSTMEEARRDAERMRIEFEAMYQRMIDNLAEIGDQIVNKLINAIDYGVERLRKDVIDYGMDKLTTFQRDFMNDIRNILRVVEDLILKASCMLNSAAKRIDDSIVKFIPDPYPSDKCRAELDKLFPNQHMKERLPTLFTDSQLYYYRKCDLMSKVDENSSMQAIFMIYNDLEKLAADMRCLAVSLNMPDLEIYYIEEMAIFNSYVRIIKQIGY